MKKALYFSLSVLLMVSLTACEKFLTRPVEDGDSESSYYQNDAQCIAGVNYLYNSPWYDIMRGFMNVGEKLSGNYYAPSDGYVQFNVSASDQNLLNMSRSLWAVNSNCSALYNRLQTANCSEEVRNQCMGEVLTWKAYAYFTIIRTFGDAPLIHDVAAEMGTGNYNSINKVKKEDLYEYVVLLLEKAMSLLPKKVANMDGRIDYYSAEALLAKVYLTKAGVTGTLSQADLDNAAKYSLDVIKNSGRELMPVYSDIFRGSNNKNIEALISWHWIVGSHWTSQNTFQSDLGMEGFCEVGNVWGSWAGPSIALQDAFGVLATDNPASRPGDVDVRRKATYMLAGDTYSYFWRDKGGFDYLRFIYDPTYWPGNLGANSSGGTVKSPTGAACVKHLYGDTADHLAECGHADDRMAYSVSTHILRLADVYLIYAESKCKGPGTSTTDADALEAFYQVRHRGRSNYNKPSSITWEDVWKERNLELALEGDRWYDYVRRSYYDMTGAISELKAQRRNRWNGDLDAVYKAYYEGGVWDASGITYDTADASASNVTEATFSVPYPSEDVVYNPLLLEEAIHVDVRETINL